MRILALDQFSDPGGAQRVLLEAITAFREQGWSVLAAMPGDGALAGSVRALGFDVAPLACGSYRAGAKSAPELLRFAAETGRMTAQIRRMVREFRPEVIYANGPRLLPAVALARTGVATVFHSHSLVPAGLLRRLSALSLRASGASVIANCRFTANQWIGAGLGDRIDVIYNGVAGPSTRTRRPTGPPAIGCIGRIAPEKGQLAFVEAAGRIREKLPGCRLVIWGVSMNADPAYEAAVRRAAAPTPIEFAGWTPDVYGALKQLDVLLAPSAPHDATTRVIPEAWAAGVPVIAFRSGGIAEIVADGENGFLVADAREMAEVAVRLLTTDRAALATVAERARATWERRFTPERFAGSMVEALSRATNGAATTIARRSLPGAARL